MIESFVLTVFIGVSLGFGSGEIGGLDSVSYTGFTSRAKCEASAVELKPALVARAREAFSGAVSRASVKATHLCVKLSSSGVVDGDNEAKAQVE